MLDTNELVYVKFAYEWARAVTRGTFGPNQRLFNKYRVLRMCLENRVSSRKVRFGRRRDLNLWETRYTLDERLKSLTSPRSYVWNVWQMNNKRALFIRAFSRPCQLRSMQQTSRRYLTRRSLDSNVSNGDLLVSQTAVFAFKDVC